RLERVERNDSRHGHHVQKQNNQQRPGQFHVWLRNAFKVHPCGRSRRAARGRRQNSLWFEKPRDFYRFHCGSVCTSARNWSPRSPYLLNMSKDDVPGEKSTTSPGLATAWARSTASASELAIAQFTAPSHERLML